MERNTIPSSISDHVLGLTDKHGTDCRRNKSVLLEHTISLPVEENFYLDSNSNITNNNNTSSINQKNNPIYHDSFQPHRTQSVRPRMVARSSVNYRHPQSRTSLQHPVHSHSFVNQSNKQLDSDHYYQPLQNTLSHTPYNTENNSVNQSVEYLCYSSPLDPLSAEQTMDSQLLSSSLSPEFMGSSPKEPRIDDLLINQKKINRSPKYFDNITANTTNTINSSSGNMNKLTRRESKSYSTTIAPIPLISYHQNVIPSCIDLYSKMTETRNTITVDRKSPNDDLNVVRTLQQQHPQQHQQHKFSVNKALTPSKARVELVLIFVKVGQVDTVNERYQADIFLQARWREPLLDAMWNKSSLKSKSSWQLQPSIENPFTDLTSKRQLNTLKLQDDEFWNPRLLIDNAEGEPIEIISHEVEFVEPDFEAYLVEKRRIKGIFHETLELRHFPFDCQDLSVTITCDRTIDEVELVASPTEVSQVDVRCAADSQEWKIFHHVDIKSMEIQTGYSPGTSKRRHPGLVFTSRSARRSGYFLVNMILISCVLCLLSFAAFSVPANENRLQLSLLLLLTTVTFKFAASQNLPKISYLTYLARVELVLIFVKVGQVDTVNERYQADIFLQARWREPLLDAMWNKSSLKSKSSWQLQPSIENPFTDLTSKRQLNTFTLFVLTVKLQDDEFWNPRLLIDNAEGEPIEIISHEVE
ncbi:unnamed protein product [Schistosoma turkestanicum]|nr:unnamed protein product [Schistosoma turkestanicum]